MSVKPHIVAVLLILWLGGCAAAPDSRPFVGEAAALGPRRTAAQSRSAVAVPETAAGPGQGEGAAEIGNQDLEHPRTRDIAANPGVVMAESAADRAANRQQLASLQRMITQRNPFLGNVADPR